ncbi:uncharacterized protein [Struthio camelus]|uniref:uncharacterized protein n=1 Tax=Struthio camelus TaxID=8801 RepID=UPI003604136C
MHYYGERYKHLCLPGSGYITESLQVCVPQADVCSTTCHPLSVTKSPMPRWPSYVQPFTILCPQPSMALPPLLCHQPYVQQCVLLGPEACETSRLLPCAMSSEQPGAAQSLQPCETCCTEKKRVAKSLPPCAPRCPEPGKLRFPPCGIKYSSSCKNECTAQGGSKRCSLPAMPGGYSRPLQGGTECPPQQCTVQEQGGFPLQRCVKGYPTQECVSACSWRQCAAPCPLPPGAKERPPPPLAKGSLPLDAAQQKGLMTPRATKSGCPHASRHHASGRKGSSHAKKSRCAAKWLW